MSKQKQDCICIFLTSGKTYSFKNINIVHDNETAITFTYTAMSDGRAKTVTFYRAHVAGVAKHEK